MEKHWLIVYDIRDTKRLAKISKCVESYGWRVQKSVFESNASDETIGQLKSRLEKLMNVEEDFVLFFLKYVSAIFRRSRFSAKILRRTIK